MINVFTVAFDQFNPSLLNKSFHFFQKSKRNTNNSAASNFELECICKCFWAVIKNEHAKKKLTGLITALLKLRN